MYWLANECGLLRERKKLFGNFFENSMFIYLQYGYKYKKSFRKKNTNEKGLQIKITVRIETNQGNDYS